MISLSPLFIAYLVVFLAGVGLDILLTRMNVRHLQTHGHKVPEALEGFIDAGKLSEIIDYTVENQRFETLTSCLGNAVFLCVIVFGGLPWLVEHIEGLELGALSSGIIFFAALSLFQGLFSLPFSYYKTFVIEQRYGFNTSTLKVWVTDILKGTVVTAIIGGVLLSSLLLLIAHGGSLWWLWAWFVFFAFQLLIIVLYPTVIAPWFNEFHPLEDEALEGQVRDLMERSGLSVSGVFRMDAERRSKHTNAYFTGLGKTKRIVLFDTLLTSHSRGEIIAILAHEVAHWKKGHVAKNLLLISLVSFLVFYTTSWLLRWPAMYEAFGFDHRLPYVGLLLAGILWEAGGRFLSPLAAAVSRRFEREADSYAAQLLKQPADLIRALKRLASDNLSNLYPHPLYAWFYYSHPPLLRRIQHLESMP